MEPKVVLQSGSLSNAVDFSNIETILLIREKLVVFYLKCILAQLCFVQRRVLCHLLLGFQFLFRGLFQLCIAYY